MASEQMTVAIASNLPHKIKKSERNERATGDQRKKFTNPTVDCHAAPNDEYSQRDCENHVTRAGDAGNRERFRFFPMLCPSRNYERQPMCRDGSVQERDNKSTDCNCCKNDGVHCSDITTSARPAWFSAL